MPLHTQFPMSLLESSINPLTIPGMLLWFDASDLSTLYQDAAKTTPITTNGEPVGCWADKSGNGRDATQDTADKRPIYRTNIINGRPAIQGDRSNDALVTAVINHNIGSGGNFYLLAVIRNTTSLTWNTILGFGDANPDWSLYYNSLYMPGRETSPSLTAVENNKNYIVEYLREGGIVSKYVNGILTEQYSNTSTYSNGTFAVCAGSGTVHYSNLYLGEVYFFNTAPSTTRRFGLRNYLKSKWGITNPLSFVDAPPYTASFIGSARTDEELATLRSSLRTAIWPSGYPTDGMTTTETIADPLSESPTNLDHVTKHTITLTNPRTAATINPVRSIHLWVPTAPNGTLVIFHRGHSSTWNELGMNSAIKSLVEANYVVAGVTMPMKLDDTLTLHNNKGYRTGNATDLSWFLDPAIRVINHYIGTYSTVYMVGLSGGGWTTDLVTALDTRVSRGVNCSGSLPLVNFNDSSRDYEQQLGGLTAQVDYTDLYLLATSNSRRYKQVLIKKDSALFDWGFYFLRPYEEAIQYYTDQFSISWDDTVTAHQLSAAGRQIVLDFFAAE
jgi:hypothetical protein